MRYATLTEAGYAAVIYDDALHGAPGEGTIPADAVEVDDAAWADMEASPGWWQWDGTAWSQPGPPPEPVLSLEALRADKVAELSAACHAAIVAGFESAALGSPHRYQSDLEWQVNLLGAKDLGTDVDFTCTEVATEVTAARTHTAAQIAQVYGDGATRKMALLAQYRTLKADALAATTEAELAAVVWTEPA